MTRIRLRYASARQERPYQQLPVSPGAQIKPLQEFLQRHAPPAFPGSIDCSQQDHFLGHVHLARHRDSPSVFSATFRAATRAAGATAFIRISNTLAPMFGHSTRGGKQDTIDLASISGPTTPVTRAETPPRPP
jgi:hypothetical protein